MDSDDETPVLSAETLAILQEFLANKEKQNLANDDSVEKFSENWQLSQFWYSTDTIKTINQVVQAILPPGGKVALISCPSLFSSLRETLEENQNVILFEFDKRFAAYEPNFSFYDFNCPLNYLAEYENAFDVVVADPPYLSEDCLANVSKTIKGIVNDKIIVCTGKVQEPFVEQYLSLQMVNFKPQHSSNLANEFSCFANFDFDSYIMNKK